MKKIILITLFYAFSANSYVPTVESLFRQGSNSEIETNGLVLSFQLTKSTVINEQSMLLNQHEKKINEEEGLFYKIYLSKIEDKVTLAQNKYSSKTYSASSLNQIKIYSDFNPSVINPGSKEFEKGIFYGVVYSLLKNDGSFLVDYLSQLGEPVRRNSDLINKEKVDFFVEYKKYLVSIIKDRAAQKTLPNPMMPSDPKAREKVNQLVFMPMYTNTNQVRLKRGQGSMNWFVDTGSFQATISYKNRQIERIRYQRNDDVFEIICKDYYRANGTHFFPKMIIVRTLGGEEFLLQTLHLKHFSEEKDDLLKRIQRWEKLVSGKTTSDSNPRFLL